MRMIILISIVFILSSCDTDLLNMVSRVSSDPFDDGVDVALFSLQNALPLKWGRDPAADSYRVERQTQGQLWELVYEGSETSYVDKGLDSERVYIYRLSKIRGEKTFVSGITTIGYTSNAVHPSTEPNNYLIQAVTLYFPIQESSYVIQGAHAQDMAIDEDWFAVDVPPMSTINVVLNDSSGSPDVNRFQLTVKGEVPQEVISNSAVPIMNVSFSASRKYFKVNLIPAVLGISTYSAEVLPYTIKVHSILPEVN